MLIQLHIHSTPEYKPVITNGQMVYHCTYDKNRGMETFVRTTERDKEREYKVKADLVLLDSGTLKQ